jgi:hypothetical protein
MKPVKNKQRKSKSLNYNKDQWAQVNWESHLLSEYHRGDLVEERWETSDDYMNWYMYISRVRVQSPSNTLSQKNVIQADHMADGKRGVQIFYDAQTIDTYTKNHRKYRHDILLQKNS